MLLVAAIGPASVDVRECGFTALYSCPGMPNCTLACSMGTKVNQYCACGYRGPLCSECDANYFAVWTGSGGCKKCDQGESHVPTALLGVFVVLCGLVFAATCVTRIKKSFPKAKQLYRLGSVKVRVLFFAAQGSWCRLIGCGTVHAR